MKKSVNSRLAFARDNNKSAAQALLLNPPKKQPIQTVLQPEAQSWRQVRIENQKAKDKKIQEIPANYECICNRQSQIVECLKCERFFFGRIAEVCQFHSNVSYLLDFFHCPSCICSKDNLRYKCY